MTRNEKEQVENFPYAEVEFTKPADQLLEYIFQFYVRLTGDKPTRGLVMETAKRVLETRK